MTAADDPHISDAAFDSWLFGQMRPVLTAASAACTAVCLSAALHESGAKDGGLFWAAAATLAVVTMVEFARLVVQRNADHVEDKPRHMLLPCLSVGGPSAGVAVPVMWRLRWLLTAPGAAISDWFDAFTSTTVLYARWGWALGGVIMAFMALSTAEQRLCLALPLIGGLASGVTIYTRISDVRGLSTFYAYNVCLLPICYGATRLLFARLVKPLWRATKFARIEQLLMEKERLQYEVQILAKQLEQQRNARHKPTASERLVESEASPQSEESGEESLPMEADSKEATSSVDAGASSDMVAPSEANNSPVDGVGDASLDEATTVVVPAPVPNAGRAVVFAENAARSQFFHLSALGSVLPWLPDQCLPYDSVSSAARSIARRMGHAPPLSSSTKARRRWQRLRRILLVLRPIVFYWAELSSEASYALGGRARNEDRLLFLQQMAAVTTSN